jgi:hypothetical protein
MEERTARWVKRHPKRFLKRSKHSHPLARNDRGEITLWGSATLPRTRGRLGGGSPWCAYLSQGRITHRFPK